MNRELKVNWPLVPQSHATNSYELMQEVIDVVRAEPRRVHMNNFIFTTLPDDNEDITRGPACGTVGCIAGWMSNLVAWTPEDLKHADAEQVAYQRLPSECRGDAGDLFWGENHASTYPFPHSSIYGTPEYAEEVIKNIEKFMRRWERILKNHQLTPPVR